jgi:hypothetical protein
LKQNNRREIKSSQYLGKNSAGLRPETGKFCICGHLKSHHAKIFGCTYFYVCTCRMYYPVKKVRHNQLNRKMT